MRELSLQEAAFVAGGTATVVPADPVQLDSPDTIVTYQASSGAVLTAKVNSGGCDFLHQPLPPGS